MYTALFNLIPMVISVNLTQNTYGMLNYDNFTTKAAAESGIFDDLITIGASTVPEGDRASFIQAFSRKNLIEAFFQGKSQVVLEHRQWGDDGVLRWMKTQVLFVKNEADEDLYEITLVQDISTQKQQELDLQNALHKASEADKAKSEFLARMSHDLRTPMNVIIGLTALTLDEAKNPISVRDNMTKMRATSDFMLGLVNDILDFAKLDKGSITFYKEKYNYSDFIIELKTMFQVQCEEKGIELSVSQSETSQPVITDKLRVKQIFFNIISNAIKYTPSGGKITFRRCNVIVDKENDKVFGEYRITDTGVGMSEEFLAHVFEPFTQERTEVTAELQGSGLGLSIAKQLVELMGGTISIESKINVGTTVTVRLPFDLASAEQHVSERPVVEKTVGFEKLHGKRVLLAEDHPLNARIAKTLLEKQEMNVVHAENGKIAVELFEGSPENTFDAILMDIRMPEMSGLEATRAIRELKRPDAKTIPIIAISANAYPEDVQKSLNAGMNYHIAKPINPIMLYETLERLCNK